MIAVIRTRAHRRTRTRAHIARFDRHCRVIEMADDPSYRIYIQRRTRRSRTSTTGMDHS